MNTKQKAILIGMILGDAYLQKTGKNNARIRLEHSEKQRDYLIWKANQFPEFFQGKPTMLTRYNTVYKKTYRYVRWQSNASPEIGKYRRIFYKDSIKALPKELHTLFVHPISLAVWYMDDGYLYQRDRIAYLYIPRFRLDEIALLLNTMKIHFGLTPTVKSKKTGNIVLVFSVMETRKLISLIRKYIIPSMCYKLLDPVSTEA